MKIRFQPAWPVALAMTLIARSAAAADTALTVGTVPGFPGKTVTVPVTVRQPAGAVAAQFEVAYNSDKVSASEALRGARLTNHILRSRRVAPGVERVLIYSLNNATLAGTNVTLGNLSFAVPAGEYVGSGPLRPTNAVLAKVDASRVEPVRLNPGAIFVRPVNPLPDGTTQFFLPSEPDTRCLIQATTDFVTWVNLTNMTATGDFLEHVDRDAGRYPHRFYRWVLSDAAGEIGAVTQLSGGELSFQLSGLVGRSYVLQASTDLRHWIDLSTNLGTTSTLNFTNRIDAAFPQRFFRLKSQ